MSKVFVGSSLWNWSIKNKYYSSKVKVHLRKLEDKTNSISKIGASIWHTGNFKHSELDLLKSWQEELSAIMNCKEVDNVEVQLIVVDHFDTENTKAEVNQWSIENGIEIIDFSEDNSDENAVEIFASSAQKRVIEALQTVMWPQFSDSKLEEDKQIGTEKDVEDFETLFANLVHFKETATGLPDDERRKFAEKVAMSFMKSLGDESGDSD